MAAALLAWELESRGVAALVGSAGTLSKGAPPPGEVVTVMAGYGLNVAGHRSRQLRTDDLVRADLVIAMAREHLREAVVMVPAAWPRSFTIRELVRRGDQAGRRPPGEDLAGWLARVHAGRSRQDLLGDSAEDDIADPIGGPLSGYQRTAEELRRLAVALAHLCWTGAVADR